MDTTELTYPIFEANQVLTNAHLNDLFEYLDEQTRLTRANLIGIGIVCGLDVEFDAPGTVHLSRGCGVTSEGYLMIEPVDLALSHVRKYNLPDDPGYKPFMEPGTEPAKSHDLWELFPDDDEPGSQPLATSGLVLEDKAVVLFHELRKDDLRNCSPNSCDDRGTAVTATARRLLVDVADLDEIIEATSGSASYLGADLTERLGLPDLRIPRFDVPSTGPVDPEKVLFAFQDCFRHTKLVAATATALNDLYEAFKPLVAADFTDNPFAAFTNRFNFLDNTPATVAQVRFMQYYWDFFDDLLSAYDEVRWAGVDLMCACCPPSGLFPRHLMVGVLDPTTFDPADYRHHFLPSPAVGECEDRTREVRQLFRRLVAMITDFTETPPDKGIRVTPSRLGNPVSAKAIPYYYDQDGTPAVYEMWNPEKTARRRANQNLSYRSDEYTPTPPTFTTNPLRYDLEPFNFFRIEGHLGKNVQSVLESLLALKKSHRLPFEVVALRAGAFDENIEIDLSKEDCRFQDLETLYKTLRSEVTCFLVKQVQYFYELPEDLVVEQPAEMLVADAPDAVMHADQPAEMSVEGEAAPSDLWLLATHAPNYMTQPRTLGSAIEGFLTRDTSASQPHVFAAADTPHLPSQAMALVGTMSDLSARLTDDIRDVDFAVLGDRYRNLVEIAGQIEDLRVKGVFDRPGLSERLDDIVFRCRLDPFDALAEEYKRRIRQVKQAQFLGHFLERHPGVQHKAGVPLDGTFVIVYHERARRRPIPETGPRVRDLLADIGTGGLVALDEIRETRVSDALHRLAFKPQLAEDPDVREVFRVLTGNVLISRVPPTKTNTEIYLDAVSQLGDGTVIADFFLPYQCCSDCPPIHYQLPSARLRVSANKGCTNSDGFADVEITTEGASGSLSVQVDGGAFDELSGTVTLAVGDHTLVVGDATGNESSPVEISISPQLVIASAETFVDEAAGTFHVVLALEGGTPPYRSASGTIVDTKFTSPAWPVSEGLTVLVEDAAKCTVEDTYLSGVSPCDLPCGGAAERHGHRFWLPEARPDLPINEATTEVHSFMIVGPDGTQHDLTERVNRDVSPPQVIRTADFGAAVERWLDRINDSVAKEVKSDKWFRLEYEAAPETATTGTLFVDRLTCIEFAFELAVEFKQGRREEPRRFEFAYDPRGTVVVEPAADSKFRLPPFEGSASNKCRPEEPPVPLCKETDLELVIQSKRASRDTMAFIADVAGANEPVAFLWEVQDGIPSVSGGEHVVAGFEPSEPADKLVRLTAFTVSGCAVTVERTFNILEPRG